MVRKERSIWKGRRERRGNGLEVEGKLWGQEIGLLVDTGATVSLLSEAWWKAAGQPGHLESVTEALHTADGKPLTVRGRVSGLLGFGEHKVETSFLVADVNSTGILGADFLRKTRAVIDLAGEQVVWADGEDTRVGVVCRNTAVLGPGSETVVEGQLAGGWTSGEAGVVEGIAAVERVRGFRVGRSLVNPDAERIPLLVCNPGPGTVTLYKGMNIATLEAIEPAKQACRMVSVEGQVHGEGNAPEGCTELDAVVRDLLQGVEAEDKSPWEALFRRNSAAFQMNEADVGHTDLVTHTIDTGESRPIRVPPRRVAPHRREIIDGEVDSMLRRGVIEPAYGPWSSPVVLVKKKDGRVRFCVDYRRLNAMTVKDAYPLPRIDDSLDSLAGARWFSTLDLASGYWQVDMAPGDKQKTAFTTHRGMYQFKVMPFGLCNAPGTFERLMEVVMRGLQWHVCLVYLDDIIIFAETLTEHEARLETVLGRLREAGLKIKASKCQLVRQSVNFLGHVVDEHGVGTDPQKVEAVMGWPMPQSVPEVRSFLGLCGYYRSFVPDFASIGIGRARKRSGRCSSRCPPLLSWPTLALWGH